MAGKGKKALREGPPAAPAALRRSSSHEPTPDGARRVTPRGAASGAFSFRLLNLSDAAALPLGSAQTLSLNPGSSAKVFSLDGNLGDYWTLNLTSLSGGSARVWVIDPDGTHLTPVANALTGGTVAAALKKTGRHTIVIEGAISNTDPVDLSWVASLTTPKAAALTIGTAVTGTTTAVGVPDKWNFSLGATNRMVFDGLSGLGNNWALRDASGAVVRSGNLSAVGVMVLAAGAYTLEVQANSAAALGAYSLRVLDVGTAQTLTLDQVNTAVLDLSSGTTIFRINTTQTDAALALDAASTNGEWCIRHRNRNMASPHAGCVALDRRHGPTSPCAAMLEPSSLSDFHRECAGGPFGDYFYSFSN